MPLRCALLILWAACSSGARDGDGERCSAAAIDEDPNRAAGYDPKMVAELRAAGYDPERAARMLWWSTKAAYYLRAVEDVKSAA